MHVIIRILVVCCQMAFFSTIFYVVVAISFNGDCALTGTSYASWPTSWAASWIPDLPGVGLAFVSAAGGILVALSILFAGAVGKVRCMLVARVPSVACRSLKTTCCLC